MFIEILLCARNLLEGDSTQVRQTKFIYFLGVYDLLMDNYKDF